MGAEDSLRITVKVTPRASRNQVLGFEDGVLRVKVTAPPVEGEANQAVVQLLADFLGVSRRDVEVVKGDTARQKIIEVRGLDRAALESKLGKLKPDARD